MSARRRWPDHVSFEEAATFEPFATSMHGVGLARRGSGETVVILGAGIIGLGAVQAIRATDVGVRGDRGGRDRRRAWTWPARWAPTR